MTFFDARSVERMSPDQRKQYDAFMKAYPHLNMQPKMETSRQLNTPVAQEMQKQAEDDFDPTKIEQEQMAPVPPRPPRPLGEMKVDPTSYISSFAEGSQAQQQQEAAQAAISPPKMPPKFSPRGKKHPIVQKMRQSLGLDSLEKPDEIEIAGVMYEMHRLMREDIGKATALASFRSSDEIGNIRANIETAIVAYSVKKIDSVKTEDVFEVPYREMKMRTGTEGPLSPKEREDKGAHLFFEFLIDSPSELTDTLVTFYEQTFPQVTLLEKNRTVALCPEADCQHKSIINELDVRYCPFHGKQLKKEGDLPNPS